jgi:hypothetical protein
MPKYLVCERNVYHYFEDYCNGLLKHGDLTLIKYQTDDEFSIDPNTQYYFCQSIPERFENTNANLNLINTEQLTTDKEHQIAVLNRLAQGVRVIDYDHYQSLSTESAIHSYLPYQFHESEDYQLQHWLQAPKIYDVAVCSLGSPRRQQIWSQLESRGLKLCSVVGWRDHRDRQIAQAKVLINIHYGDDYQIFEHFRCDRWILAGQLVVSESSLSDDLLDHKDLIILSNYDDLVDKVCDVIHDYSRELNQYKTQLRKRKTAIMNQRFERYKTLINTSKK